MLRGASLIEGKPVRADLQSRPKPTTGDLQSPSESTPRITTLVGASEMPGLLSRAGLQIRPNLTQVQGEALSISGEGALTRVSPRCLGCKFQGSPRLVFRAIGSPESLTCPGNRQPEGKCGPIPNLLRTASVPPRQHREFARDGEPKACPSLSRRLPRGLVELLEDVAQLFGRDAYPVSSPKCARWLHLSSRSPLRFPVA